MRLLKATLLLLILFPQISHAHLLKVFAYQQPASKDQMILITGKVYFSGGTFVANAPIEVLNTQESVVFSAKTNIKGEFSFEILNGNYLIVANSLDGHIAKWKIKSTQVIISHPKDKDDQFNSSSALQVAKSADLTNNIYNQPFPTLWEAQIEKAVAAAVAKQIQPLTEQIINLEEKAKFSDILGAVGYIFGVFGLLIWWKQPNKNRIK